MKIKFAPHFEYAPYEVVYYGNPGDSMFSYERHWLTWEITDISAEHTKGNLRNTSPTPVWGDKGYRDAWISGFVCSPGLEIAFKKRFRLFKYI